MSIVLEKITKKYWHPLLNCVIILIGKEVNGMEVFSTVAGYIGTLGFPIVCCGVLFYFVNSTLKELRDIISKNTVAITTLIEKLDKG